MSSNIQFRAAGSRNKGRRTVGVGTEVRTWHDGMLEFGMDSKHPSENHEFSILGEMVIKGKDSIDIKALHQSKGCAISKTP